MNTERITKLLQGSKGVLAFDDYATHTDKSKGGPGAIEIETGLLLYSMVRRMRPQVVVETGTFKGFSAAWMASALKDTFESTPFLPMGHLWTAEYNDQQPQKLWKELDINEVITYEIANSRAWFPKLPGPIEFLWIDADHSKEAVYDEFMNYLPMMADKCIIGFHDTWLVPEIAMIVDDIESKLSCHKFNHKYFFIDHLSFRNMRGCDFLILNTKPPQHMQDKKKIDCVNKKNLGEI